MHDSYFNHQGGGLIATNISLTLTIQQVSDFIQVNFKIGDLATKENHVTHEDR